MFFVNMFSNNNADTNIMLISADEQDLATFNLVTTFESEIRCDLTNSVQCGLRHTL